MASLRLPELYEPTELEQTFASLVAQWHEETDHLSSLTGKVLHPAYQRIIGMGRQALPLLLRELQAHPDHWFWALHAISGEDPARPGDNFMQATQVWLQWGRERGYIE